MFYQKSTEEDKLSTHLSDGNPYKKKLEMMENPEGKHHLYVGLVISLLAYEYIYFGALMYMGVEDVVATCFLLFSSLIVWRAYKKRYMAAQEKKYRIEASVVAIVMIILSVFVFLHYFHHHDQDSWDERFMILLNPFADKARATCAFFAISALTSGISVSYLDCPYSVYKTCISIDMVKYGFIPVNKIINKWYIVYIAAICGIYFAFNGMLRLFHDEFWDRGQYGQPTYIVWLYLFPYLFVSGFSVTKYYKTYKKALKFEVIK